MRAEFESMFYECPGNGYPPSVIVNAKRYTAAEALEIFKFERPADHPDHIESAHAAWRVHSAWDGNEGLPIGQYCIVERGARGAFPVWVIPVMEGGQNADHD